MHFLSFSSGQRVAGSKAAILQAVALAAVMVLGWWLVHNAIANLSSRNIASGFGFLNDIAGFAISEGLVAYDMDDSYLRAFAAGISNTLRAALPAVLIASLLGLALGIAQVSKHPVLSRVARLYVDVVRNVPLLVQVLMWYFALTEMLPSPEQPAHWADLAFLSKGGLAVASPVEDAMFWSALAGTAVVAVVTLMWSRSKESAFRAGHWTLPLGALLAIWWFTPMTWIRPHVAEFGVSGGAVLSPEWLALVMALSLYGAAYCAEIVRAGLEAVPRGQWEAAHALGLTWAQSLKRVILPQGLRVMVPPYTSLIMNTVKNSSLAVAVGYPDIVSVTTTAMNQNGQAIECIAIIASVYLVLNLLTALVMAVVNVRVQIKER